MPEAAELFQVVTVEEARRRIAAAWRGGRAAPERLSLIHALGRRLAAALASGEDVPGFNRSTVDGFAVRSADTFGASESLPAYLKLAGEVEMGKTAGLELGPGYCAAVATGGMLPPGADGVVMVEYTEMLGGETVSMSRPVAPGENVIRKGEDVAAGQEVLPAGCRLRPQEIGLLAALGFLEVEVAPRLKVGIVSTGNELVPPQEKPGPGQVRDVNSYTLFGQVLSAGGQPSLYGIIPDDQARLAETVRQALSENDLLLLSGGSSVGARDLTLQVLEDLGSGGVLFHGISLRPGKPTLAVAAGQGLAFGLPGHPVSAMVVFDLLVRPLLEEGGYGEESPAPALEATLTRNLASAAGREDHVRVRLKRRGQEWLAEPVLGKAGLLSSMVKADGVVVIPLEAEGFNAGSRVMVRLI